MTKVIYDIEHIACRFQIRKKEVHFEAGLPMKKKEH